TSAQEDLLRCERHLEFAASSIAHAGGPSARELDVRNHRTSEHAEIRSAHDRPQIPDGRAAPQAVPRAQLKMRRPFGLRIVVVRRTLAATLAAGLEERVRNLVAAKSAHRDRPADPAVGAIAKAAVLEAHEVRKDIAPSPSRTTASLPFIISTRMPTNKEHSIHRARPSQHLAAGPIDPSPEHFGLRLRVGLPDEPVVVQDLPDTQWNS